MGLRLFYLGLVLFIAVWFVAFRPYEVEGRQKGGGAQIAFEAFVYKELDNQGTRIWVEGRRGTYNERRMEAFDLFVRDVNSTEILEADRGVYQDGVLEAQGRVRYRKDPYRFRSERALYDTRQKKLHVPTHFFLERTDFNATGSELFYYKKSGKIVAYNIKAKALFR